MRLPVVNVEPQPVVAHTIDDAGEEIEQPDIFGGFVVERRLYANTARSDRDSVTGQPDRIWQRKGAGTDQHALGWQPACPRYKCA